MERPSPRVELGRAKVEKEGAVAKAPAMAEGKAECKALAGVDATLERVRLRLGDLAVLGHLVDGLQFRLLQVALSLGRTQMQDRGQFVDEYLGIVRARPRPRRGGGGVYGGHSDSERGDASHEQGHPPVGFHRSQSSS